MEKLSIIVPVYNAQKYLSETIKSILCQTYKDFELILIDDGSKDLSGQMCDDFAKKDKRIKVFHKPNGGVSSARNAGISAASGDYIGFVDSDDIISPIMYEAMMQIATSQDADIVQCMHTRDKEELSAEVPSDVELKVYDNIGALKRIYNTHYTNMLSLCSKLYKRELYSGIKFPEDKVFEDDDIVPKLLYKAKKYIYVDKNYYCYIKRNNSIITGTGFKQLQDLTGILQERTEAFEKIDTELYAMCVKHFMFYLIGKLCNCYNCGEGLTRDKAKYFQSYIKKNRKRFSPYGNKYDKIYLWLISIGSDKINAYIAKNDYEPLQNMIRKIKRVK